MKCPNCNAELETRPCTACGWPESTRPPPLTSWQKLTKRMHRNMENSHVRTGCGGGCGTCLALGSTAGLVFFYSWGAANAWTSDGPGALIFYLGVAVFGLIAAFAWLGLLYEALRPYLPAWLRFLVDLVLMEVDEA